MAEKKPASKAEKKVTEAKEKKPSAKSSAKSTTKKSTQKAVKKTTAAAQKNAKAKTEYDNPISASFVVAFLSLALFVLFVIISVNPDGALLKVVKSVVLGLIGQAGFYLSLIHI